MSPHSLLENIFCAPARLLAAGNHRFHFRKIKLVDSGHFGRREMVNVQGLPIASHLLPDLNPGMANLSPAIHRSC